MTIGEIIREKRLSEQISCRRLAAETGLSLSTIFRLENGVMNHHKTTLKLVANALGLDVKEIIKQADDM